ncbi:MAG: hypothetical protein CVT88_05140 [Candidatus Altiarchaeales archaeon HGW-Altiarchaeales-1]|nr:MAG: hypothetical protein CVT88_05140 [Candidatus Altiarchaeales archaeon HGW-Altiarchaeales-1]
MIITKFDDIPEVQKAKITLFENPAGGIETHAELSPDGREGKECSTTGKLFCIDKEENFAEFEDYGSAGYDFHKTNLKFPVDAPAINLKFERYLTDEHGDEIPSGDTIHLDKTNKILMYGFVGSAVLDYITQPLKYYLIAKNVAVRIDARGMLIEIIMQLEDEHIREIERIIGDDIVGWKDDPTD